MKKDKTPNATDRPRTPPRPLDDGNAFLPDYRDVGPLDVRSDEELSETLGEEFVSSATHAVQTNMEDMDKPTTEEIGGPFVEVSANDEFASTTDDMNPEDAPREPFPSPMRTSSR